MSDPSQDDPWVRRLPVLLLTAVIGIACCSCFGYGVRAVKAVPEMFPSTYDDDRNRPADDPVPERMCPLTDPVVVAELSRDPLVTTVPPDSTPRRVEPLENCRDSGGVGCVVDGPIVSPEPVVAHYRALLLAAGWTLSNPPAEGALISAKGTWRDRAVFFSLRIHEEAFLATIEIIPR